MNFLNGICSKTPTWAEVSTKPARSSAAPVNQLGSNSETEEEEGGNEKRPITSG